MSAMSGSAFPTVQDYEILAQLLGDTEKPLESVAADYSRRFQRGDLFRTCTALSVFLHDHFLKPAQRVAALFLLFDSYKTEVIEQNPFAPILYHHATCGSEPEAIVTFLITLLQKGSRDFLRQSPRDILLSCSAAPLPSPRPALSPLPLASKIGGIREVGVSSRIIDPEMGLCNPWADARTDSTGNSAVSSLPPLAENELAPLDFQPPTLCPPPPILPPRDDEVSWLHMGMVHELLWDPTTPEEEEAAASAAPSLPAATSASATPSAMSSGAPDATLSSSPHPRTSLLASADIPPDSITPPPTTSPIPPLAPGNDLPLQLLQRAFTVQLTPPQADDIIKAMETDPRLPLRAGLTPANFSQLVEHCPAVAAETFLKLMSVSAPDTTEYLGALVRMPVSLHSMEVVNQLGTLLELPAEFVQLFVKNCLSSTEGIADPAKHARHARLVSVFLTALIRSRNIDLSGMSAEIGSFCLAHGRIQEANRLYHTLRQLHQEGTLPPPDAPSPPPVGEDARDGSPLPAQSP
ncbi:putative CCR4-NOT transcription complex subunit 11 [Paratrimastix pyriformis]|uniref:CCR4-NOT transcription complex subunit 11 n=1 Tax=Paratrimastix pyriformis TaxID=342808 RepID=A0ABQ8UTM2_9EUKA|nr:putative CCR4-NOT transcription complex subunit 11 [Paratrimastix pyriformis]